MPRSVALVLHEESRKVTFVLNDVVEVVLGSWLPVGHG